MSWFCIPRRKLVRERLRSHPIDRAHEVAVVYRSVPRFYGPHWLSELTHRGRRVEHDLRAVQSETHPIQGVVPAVADVHSYLRVLGLKHGVPGVTLHVIRRLVEVVHSGYVVLPVLSDDVAVVPHHHRGVPHRAVVGLVPLQYRRHDDHVPLLRQLLDLQHAGPSLEVLGELAPPLLPRAERERHVPCLLQAEHLHPRLAG
mmetsp:Transcript_13823/g.39009  ORF Transcript_13823/g.39009 Transcript_13823/m.39009 type:complete len:201 (-) Transcript_13823:711-1313(-)